MEKLCVFLVLALAFYQALGIGLRQRRQSENNEEDLEDRYGWDSRPARPNWNQFQQRPTRPVRPGQGQFPEQGQFPGQGQLPGQGQFPGQGQLPGQGQQTSTTPATAGTTTVSSVVQECIRTCPVTSEYNPVCGTNNVTYTNPGRLTCAQNCGTAVSLFRSTPCPAAPTS